MSAGFLPRSVLHQHPPLCPLPLTRTLRARGIAHFPLCANRLVSSSPLSSLLYTLSSSIIPIGHIHQQPPLCPEGPALCSTIAPFPTYSPRLWNACSGVTTGEGVVQTLVTPLNAWVPGGIDISMQDALTSFKKFIL